MKDVLDISVVIPTFNRSNYIEKTIETISQQTRFPKEIIIVDDCSQDDTLKKIEAIKSRTDLLIKVIALKENKGACAARNIGVREAKGKWKSFELSECY